MASVDFILPGRRHDSVPFSKASLGKAFATSRATNPRNIEYPWYGCWSQILVDLTSQYERLVIIPQHLLYYTPAESDSLEADDITVDDPDSSFSSIPSVATTAPQPFAYEIIPDFAVIRITFCWKSEGPRTWRNVKIQHAGVPLIVEIKRAGSRSAGSLEETLVHMIIAQNEAMLQAAYLFRMIPIQKSVMLMACTGLWWSCRIVTKDEVQHLEAIGAKVKTDIDFSPDEDECDGDSDDEMDGNELTNDDLNQLEDDADSAVSAHWQDGGTDADESRILEPIVDEAELELPIPRWTNAMRLEGRASNQKLFLIHRRLEQVLRDNTRTMG